MEEEDGVEEYRNKKKQERTAGYRKHNDRKRDKRVEKKKIKRVGRRREKGLQDKGKAVEKNG